jgi:hypothetical protein
LQTGNACHSGIQQAARTPGISIPLLDDKPTALIGGVADRRVVQKVVDYLQLKEQPTQQVQAG